MLTEWLSFSPALLVNERCDTVARGPANRDRGRPAIYPRREVSRCEKGPGG